MSAKTTTSCSKDSTVAKVHNPHVCGVVRQPEIYPPPCYKSQLKVFLNNIFTLNFKALFVPNTDNFFIQAFRYVFVGGIAFIADAGSLYLFSLFGIHYLVCTAIAFVIGLAVNYTLSKIFVFTQNAKTGKAAEFIIYGVIGLIGLGLTEFFMWLFTSRFGLFFIISKVISAIIVLVWNFLVRKIVLYRKEETFT